MRPIHRRLSSWGAVLTAVLGTLGACGNATKTSGTSQGGKAGAVIPDTAMVSGGAGGIGETAPTEKDSGGGTVAALGGGGGTASINASGGMATFGGATASPFDAPTTSSGGITASGGTGTTASGGTATSLGGRTIASGGTVASSGGTITATGGATTGTGGHTTASGGSTAVDAPLAGGGGSIDGGAVMVGPACGRPSQRCCAGNTCADGGCCLDGECIAARESCTPIPGTCTNGVCGSCGGAGMPPCQIIMGSIEGDSFCTAASTVQYGDLCVPCGHGAGEHCCQLTTTGGYDTNVCFANGVICAYATGTPAYCTICGGPADPCCSGDVCADGACCYAGRCVAANTGCGTPASGADGSPGGTCTSGHCSDCGGQGQICCGGSKGSCGTGLRCQSGRCSACGGAGQPCCSGTNGTDRCATGSLCSTNDPAADGVCALCGGPGQPCCAGDRCDRNGCCLAGKCLAEGSDCINRSVHYGQCTGGTCACGSLNQPCCPYSSDEPDMAGHCSARELGCSSASGLIQGTCLTCGKLAGPCCDYEKCEGSGLQCIYEDSNDLYPLGSYSCQKCGGVGEACCEDNYGRQICNDPGTLCDSSTSPSTCTVCGVEGGPCCSGDVCPDSGMTCLLRRCLKCGGAGQPCCAGGSCTSGCCVSQWDSLVENGPTCAAVGSACEPASSTSPICSANGSCTTTGTSCGGLGQACCLSTRYPTSTSYSYCSAQGTRCLYSATTRNDVCTPCGDKGQPCCLNGTTEQRCKTPYDCSSDTCQPRASTSTATATSTSITQ